MKLTDDELTRLVAEGIMGWHCWDNDGDYNGPTPMFAIFGSKVAFYGDAEEPQRDCNFLNDWSGAGEVVERMTIRGWWCRVESPFTLTDPYRAGFCPLETTGWSGRMDHSSSSASGPRAITMAALIACGLITENGEAK